MGYTMLYTIKRKVVILELSKRVRVHVCTHVGYAHSNTRTNTHLHISTHVLYTHERTHAHTAGRHCSLSQSRKTLKQTFKYIPGILYI